MSTLQLNSDETRAMLVSSDAAEDVRRDSNEAEHIGALFFVLTDTYAVLNALTAAAQKECQAENSAIFFFPFTREKFIFLETTMRNFR